MERKELINKIKENRSHRISYLNLILGLIYGLGLSLLGNFIINFIYDFIKLRTSSIEKIIIFLISLISLIILIYKLIKKLNEIGKEISDDDCSINSLEEFEKRDKNKS